MSVPLSAPLDFRLCMHAYTVLFNEFIDDSLLIWHLDFLINYNISSNNIKKKNKQEKQKTKYVIINKFVPRDVTF